MLLLRLNIIAGGGHPPLQILLSLHQIQSQLRLVMLSLADREVARLPNLAVHRRHKLFRSS